MRRHLHCGAQTFVMDSRWGRFARSYGCTSQSSPEAESAVAPPLEPAASTVERDTWVQFELLDMDNQPVPGEKYRITTPDGKSHEGKTDLNGVARVIGIPQDGSCALVYPDLDEAAWEAA
jgi:hypothetical protein